MKCLTVLLENIDLFIPIIGHIKHLERQFIWVGWARAHPGPPLATPLHDHAKYVVLLHFSNNCFVQSRLLLYITYYCTCRFWLKLYQKQKILLMIQQITYYHLIQVSTYVCARHFSYLTTLVCCLSWIPIKHSNTSSYQWRFCCCE